MDVFVGIDGSGTPDDKVYKKEFSNSFVNRLKGKFPLGFYHRGPDSFDTMNSANNTMISRLYAVHAITACMKRFPDMRLFLAGYSRGAAAMLDVCVLLKQRTKQQVHGLILYDAVDMSALIEGSTVPSNVKNCIHFRRKASTLSRVEFLPGKAGTTLEKGIGSYTEQEYFCTHGAAGGTVFDKSASNNVFGTISESWSPVQSQVTPAHDELARRQIWLQTEVFLHQVKGCS